MKLTIGISPCPNDTFIFDALHAGTLDTGGLSFDFTLQDVQTLNEGAAAGKWDVAKLSYPALFDASDRYELLPSGAALGRGVGPLLVARSLVDKPDPAHCIVAVPGENTTAHFLLSFAHPELTNKVFLPFHEIEGAVLEGRAHLGVLIHEGRFTYAQRGLIKVADLGSVWEDRQEAPIPLGGIAIRRDLPEEIKEAVGRLIRQSLERSRARYPELSPFVRQHAQEMDDGVMRQHIDLYVNEYSIDLGEEGRRAVGLLHKTYCRLKDVPEGALHFT